MILKIGNGNEWSYIDNITSLNITNKKKEDYPIAPRVYFIPSCDGGEPAIDKEFILTRKNDTEGKMEWQRLYLISAPFIYILSDEGKTIERIN